MKLAWVLALAAGCAGASTSQPSTTTASSTTTTSDTATALPASTSTSTSTTVVAPSYSCFSYTSGAAKRYGCARTTDCEDYLEQARTIGGLKDLDGCAKVDAVFCFSAKTDTADASDICQPTMELCTAERAGLKSADSDCARR